MDDKLEELWEAPPDHGQPAGNQYRLLPSDHGEWNLEENRWQGKKWLGWRPIRTGAKADLHNYLHDIKCHQQKG
jgi:hypothetical protein